LIAYVLPFVLYLLGTNLAAQSSGAYPLAYSAVVAVVAAATYWLVWRPGLLQPHQRVAAGVLVGLTGIVWWIGACELGLEESLAPYLPTFLRPEARVAFNPFVALPQPLAAWGFVAVRLLGLAVLVPLAEELFWRGFLLRWFVSPEWQDVPLGKFTPGSFAVVTLLFTLAHPEWLAAAGYCALLNGLLYWKKDLWNCVVAHAVSNLVLGCYVLVTGAWRLW